MRFWAKLSFKNKAPNVDGLIKAFFKDFNPNSSIFIKGNTATIEIYFDGEPPKSIINAISYCNIVDFTYSGKNEKYVFKTEETKRTLLELLHRDFSSYVEAQVSEQEPEVQQEEAETEAEAAEQGSEAQQEEAETEAEAAEQGSEAQQEENETEAEVAEQEPESQQEDAGVEAEVAEQEPEVQQEEAETEAEVAEQEPESQEEPAETEAEVAKQETEAKKKEVIPEIPELRKIAQKASSFDKFFDAVAVCLDLRTRASIFKEYVNAVIASSVATEDITWDVIKASFKDNKIEFKNWDYIVCAKAVKAKLGYANISILTLIKAIVEYKTYYFDQKEEKENNADESQTSADMTEIAATEEKNLPSKKVKMNCVPDIPAFEEKLEKLDKTLPIGERVKYILEVMKIDKVNNKQKKQIIYAMSNAVMMTKDNDESIICQIAKIPAKDVLYARMVYSDFVRNYVSAHCSGSYKGIKVRDFLSDLREVVLTEDELNGIK